MGESPLFLLTFHVVVVGILIVVVWAFAYGQGRRAGERRARRLAEAQGARQRGVPAPDAAARQSG